MTYRMLFVGAAAIVFAWGFSTLVEHQDRSMRYDNAHIACSGWAGDNCTRANIR